jgi:hypothetical protein
MKKGSQIPAGYHGEKKRGRVALLKNINAYMCFSCKQLIFQSHPLSMEERLGAATWPPIILTKSAQVFTILKITWGTLAKHIYGLGTL